MIWAEKLILTLLVAFGLFCYLDWIASSGFDQNSPETFRHALTTSFLPVFWILGPFWLGLRILDFVWTGRLIRARSDRSARAPGQGSATARPRASPGRSAK